MEDCSFAWAYEKAMVWANSMGRPELVVEFKKGKFDSMSKCDVSHQIIVCLVMPSIEKSSQIESKRK